MTITAHCLVKNEERFIWYALMSVLPHVDEVLVWDTGSFDKTVEIIKSINNPKIKFQEKGEQDLRGIASLREKMINETNSDWIMVLDGDEIWWNKTFENIKTHCLDNTDVIVSPVWMLIGDIFHYQPESAGKYKIANRNGHYNLRFIRKISGLHVEGKYPNECYVTKEGIKIQNLPKNKICFSNDKYLHASHLRRSRKDDKKYKYEIGNQFSKDFFYPEVFFLPRPDIVPNVWDNMDTKYKMRAFAETPLKNFKRTIL